jgi:putative PEP-CTERM system histidine kinase
VNWVGVLGYGAAALAFAVLAGILQAGWRGRGPGIRLIAAVAANAVWAGFMAREYWTGMAPILPHLLVEGGRAAAWVFVLGGLATSGGAPRRYVAATYLLCGAGLLITVLTGLWEGFGVAMGEPGHATAVAAVAFPIAVLILLEQIYRNSHASGRRAFRPLLVGVGGLFAFDLFMYGEGLMNVTVGVHTLELRALVNLACVPAIALAARRNPLWSLDVFVSRQMAFYSTMLLSVGLYFLAMAAGGYVLGALGVEWGRAAQVAFMGGAGVVLAILVASGSVRARIRVFLSKHFYSNKYDYRVEWLRFVNTLESGAPEAEALPAMIRAVAQIIGSRFGTLSIRTDEGRRLLRPASSWSFWSGGTGSSTLRSTDGRPRRTRTCGFRSHWPCRRILRFWSR